MTQIKIPENWQWPGAEVNSTKVMDHVGVDTVQTETRIPLIEPKTWAKVLAHGMIEAYGKDVAALILCDAAEECLK